MPKEINPTSRGSQSKEVSKALKDLRKEQEKTPYIANQIVKKKKKRKKS